jgi:L-iditol 2-dehydrogenase
MQQNETVPRTMRALVNYGPEDGSVALREVPVPQPQAGEVLLRVRAVGTCGSDLHQYHGTQSWAVDWPVILGHEFCGEVAALGAGVTGWQPGDRVVCETAARTCGTCALCRTAHYNLCPSRKGFGYGVDGACASFVAVRAHLLHRLPDQVSWLEGAVTEPCCNAATAVLVHSQLRAGETAVVLGPGPIGLLCTQMLHTCTPAHLVVAGLAVDAPRLALAERFGATRTVFTDREPLEPVVRRLGDGLGAHLVVDAAGVSAALAQALAVVRPGGQITKIGWGPQPLEFSLDPLVAKAVRLQGSFSHTWETWERVLRLLALRAIDVRPLVREYALADWQAGFAAMERREIGKAVLRP